MPTADLLTRLAGWRIPLGERLIRWLKRLSVDAEGYEGGQRINGYVECPRCGLCWPLIEEPEAWEQEFVSDGDGEPMERWKATEWGPGTAECLECNLCFVDSFEGTFVLRIPPPPVGLVKSGCSL